MNLLMVGRPSTKKEKAIAAVQKLEADTIRMNVNLSKEFYKAVKQFALEKDITVTDFVVRALNEYMSK